MGSLSVTERRFQPLTLLLYLILLCPVLLNGCRKREVSPGLPAPPPPQAGVTRERAVLEGAELTYKDPEGNTLWTVTAKEGTGEVSSMTAVLKDVRCTLYAEGKPSWVCRADQLTAEQPTKQVRLTGNVTGSSSDGQRSFFAPAVTWDIDSGSLTGGPDVKFRMGKVELTGDRLVASTRDGKGKVLGHVQGRLLR